MILHLVTDGGRIPGAGDFSVRRSRLVAQALDAIAAGVDAIQVRERDLEAAQLAAIVDDLVALARGTSTRILVNDRLDVAIACGAGGVHLRADSIAAQDARRIAPPGFVVGRSVHAVAEAQAAADAVDYLIAGTVWPTASKPAGHEVIGVAGLARIAAAVPVPVLAIGGVTIERLPAIAATGARGAAAIGLFAAAGLGKIVHAARAAFDTPGSAS